MLKDYSDNFNDRYNLDVKEEDDIVEILNQIAYKVGAISNGEVDYEKVYTIILKDLREGRFKGVTFDCYEDR